MTFSTDHLHWDDIGLTIRAFGYEVTHLKGVSGLALPEEAVAIHQSFYDRFTLTRNRHVRSVVAGRHGRAKSQARSFCVHGGGCGDPHGGWDGARLPSTD
jgi:hypothetical protein